MTSRTLRLALTTTLATGLLALGASPAYAVDTLFFNSDQPSYTDDPGEASTLTVTASPTSITFSQAGGDAIDSDDDDCTGDNTATVTCTPANIDETEFGPWDADMGDLADTVTANGTLGGYMDGDEGADNLTGSNENGSTENLTGGQDNDTINSRNVGPPIQLITPIALGDGFSANVTDFASGGEDSDVITTGNGDDVADGDFGFFVAATDGVGGGDGFPIPPEDFGTDVISTGTGNDRAAGSVGNGDQVSLGEGDDTAIEFAGDGTGDAVDGGPGIDRIQLSSFGAIQAADSVGAAGADGQEAPSNFDVNLVTGATKITNAPLESDTTANFEDASTSSGNDVVAGSDVSNIIDTWTGNDTATPGAGTDTLFLDPSAGGVSALTDGADGNGQAFFGDDTANVVDGFGDRVFCGGGVDSIAADQFDQVSTDCENVSRSETRAGGADVLAPDCTLSKVKRSYSRNAFFRGFNVAVACNEGGTLIIQLLAAFNNKLFSAGAGDVVLAEKRVTLTGANTSTKIKPLKKFKRRLRKKGFRARVNLEAVDQYGNRSVERKALKVKKTKSKAKKRKRR